MDGPYHLSIVNHLLSTNKGLFTYVPVPMNGFRVQGIEIVLVPWHDDQNNVRAPAKNCVHTSSCAWELFHGTLV